MGGSGHRKVPTCTGQHKHREKVTRIHASNDIRSHDPSVQTGEDLSCLRRRSYGDRPHYRVV
jgi:hypothetical protein